MLGGVRQPRNEIVAMKSILCDIYPPNGTARLTSAIVLPRPPNETEISHGYRGKTIRRECGSAKTRSALGKPGTETKSRVWWRALCGCFATGPLASSIG